MAGWVSPNPGGVGPMTRAMLLSNIVSAAEQSLDAALTGLDARTRRTRCKRPQTLGGVVYLGVVAASLVGLGHRARRAPGAPGSRGSAPALLVAACTRLVLSERRAGMLRVRRKWSDVLMLTVAGVGLIVLTIVDPEPAADVTARVAPGCARSGRSARVVPRVERRRTPRDSRRPSLRSGRAP